MQWLKLVFAITLCSLLVSSCCRDKKQPPRPNTPICNDPNSDFNGVTCTCKQGYVWNNTACQYFGMSFPDADIFLGGKSACNDWRDSLYFIANTTTVHFNFGLVRYYKNAEALLGSALVDSLYSKPNYDSFMVPLVSLYSTRSTWLDTEDCTVTGKINKTRDTCWMKIINLIQTSSGLNKEDSCDVVFTRL
ncbi:MAG: hypothetical protein RL660_1115 [Bacteroidota bacterium]|jgi:hypothetical protein